jgi:uncharacterized protein
MIDDVFVVDGVVHVMDFSFDHLKVIPTPEEQKIALEFAKRYLGPMVDRGIGPDVEDYRKGSAEANYNLLFREGPTDMAIVGNIPFNGINGFNMMYDDPDYLLNMNHRMSQLYPERCIFTGGVEPVGMPMPDVLAFVDRQAEMGAKSMKLYPLHYRADDRELAYPIYERCLERGIEIVQFHVNRPADRTHDVEVNRPNWVQQPARDFPEMTFVLHHPEHLYFDETINIVSRFPNVWLLCSPLIQMIPWRPRYVQEMLGEILQVCGSDKLVYGSEGAIVGNPAKYIEAFMELEMPEDLQRGFSYPQITREDKEKILGLNAARLFGIDVEAKKKELAELAEPSHG